MGVANGGHILPEETIVAEPFEVEAFGIDGAMFVAERGYRDQFQAVRAGARAAATDASTDSRAFALRLRPNQDFACALEAFCRQHGILPAPACTAASAAPSARVLPTAASVVPFATELAVRAGTHRAGRRAARWRPTLDIALVDYLGGLAEGRLVRGDNPVLMTMELVLEVL